MEHRGSVVTEAMTTETATISEVSAISVESIERVYSGKPWKCMCGCSGTYSEQPGRKQQVLRQVQQHAREGNDVEVLAGYIYTAFIGQRQYSIYLHN